MHAFKYAHTLRVVRNAELIIAGESSSLSEECQEASLIAAWFHDIGRFEQHEKYQTFSDIDSVDHALYSCMIALREGLLDDLTPVVRNLVLLAIQFHNKKSIPSDLTDDEKSLRIVRDADKLDSFYLFDETIKTDYLLTHPEVYSNLPFLAPPNPEIVEDIQQGKTVNFSQIKSFVDYVIIQVG